MGFWKRKRRDEGVVRLGGDVVLEVKDRDGRVLQTIDAAKLVSMVHTVRAESSTREALADATRFISFRTNAVVASDAMDRGCAGMDAGTAMRVMLKPGDEVDVRHEGRSVRMTLRSSDNLLPGEVELNPDDLIELGIDEGDTDYLEVVRQEGTGRGQRSGAPVAPDKEATAYRVRVDSDGNPVEVTEVPPHAPKKVFRFLGRRVR